MTKVEVMKRWASGDLMYGAVKAQAPAGTHQLYFNGREYPVAQLHVQYNWAGQPDECSVARWCPRSEAFPEPIKGWN